MPAEGAAVRRIAIALAAAVAVLPSIRYLSDLRYRLDPALKHAVCQSLACSEDLLLDSAKRASEGGPSNIPVVLANLQEAVRRNIASPNRWCDLGQALRQARRIDEARYCYSEALELGSRNPPVLWKTALFYMRIKERRNALKYMAQLLELAPEYKDLIFYIYVINIRDVADTFEFGIPKQRQTGQDYFRYILTKSPVQDVKKAWKWMKANGLADRETAGLYVDFLIAHREFSSAPEVWLKAAGPDKRYLKPNLVYNGDFEMEPAQVGLDWTFHPNRGVRIRRVSTTAFSGSSSMEIEFDGSENIEFNDLAQRTIVEPGRYKFKAWVRTSGLTTDQGIGFRLVDPSNRVNPITTRVLTQTHDWTPVETEYAWPGPTGPLRIEVVRHTSLRFDNKVKGRVWIDAISLTKAAPAPHPPTLAQQLSAQ